MKALKLFFKGLKWLCLIATAFYVMFLMFGFILLRNAAAPVETLMPRIKEFGLLAFLFFIAGCVCSIAAGEYKK